MGDAPQTEGFLFDFATIAGHSDQRDVAASIFVNVPERNTLLADVEVRLIDRKGFSLATLNLDHLVKLRNNSEFFASYTAHTHIVADGNPVVWLCRLAGQRVSLVPGSELVEPVASIAARLGVSVALVGTTEASLRGAANMLSKRYPDITIVARIAPAMDFDPSGPSADALIEDLRASGAQLCFLALGAPKQEIFAARAQLELPKTGFISVGAGIDFLSGMQRRAPLWMQKTALEWFWRLAGNPRRLLFRYASCFLLLPTAIRSALSARYK